MSSYWHSTGVVLCTAAIIAIASTGAGADLAGTNAVSAASPAAAATSAISRPADWAVPLHAPGLKNFYRVSTNLYRGAQPTAQGMAELKKLGIRTVFNLRSLHSDSGDLVSGMKQARLHMKPWHAEDEDMIAFLRVVSDTNNLPVFVHCQRGADRTGLACAMYRVAVQGWPKNEAIREMREGGFEFNPAWKNIVRYIERADVNRIRQEAGIAPPPALSAE
jgi:protein tyrosine phosphatase (PTP) superfamily phosphohydrolase (DUF442 family)